MRMKNIEHSIIFNEDNTKTHMYFNVPNMKFVEQTIKQKEEELIRKNHKIDKDKLPLWVSGVYTNNDLFVFVFLDRMIYETQIRVYDPMRRDFIEN
jgi:hypothetical protein